MSRYEPSLACSPCSPKYGQPAVDLTGVAERGDCFDEICGELVEGLASTPSRDLLRDLSSELSQRVVRGPKRLPLDLGKERS